MSNHHLKNKNLTLKAKGLMSLLLSLPDDWVHTLAGLAQISVEGVDAIRMAVHELEREGYVVRNRIRNEKGLLGEMEYVVYENPQTPVVAEAPASASPTLEEPMLENPIQGNPTQGNPMLDHPTQGNPMQLNTFRSNTHTLKWTDEDVIYVLASETYETDDTDFTVTDYAFPLRPMTYALRPATPMNGFSLRDISADLGNFFAGQTGLHGSSGRDRDYEQIATLPGHGKIYATPHYLEGYVVYCLEHPLPGPGERISSGGYQPTGPYTVVDLTSYMNTPGYSGVMYKNSTMHAIGWVLRHTVPFMELDRSDSDNRTWSRVAGQFAIREVIKQLEGAQYVRDYWQMEDFYAASDNAPAVYLEYARWLAVNGMARASMTGKITASNKSVTTSGNKTIGTVTLTTDADLIRISKSYGTVTGHTYGEDSSYYYLNSGDTITIASNATAFSFKAESMAEHAQWSDPGQTRLR